MAKAHSEWITEFLCDLSTDDMTLLNSALIQLKQALQTRLSKSNVALVEAEDLQADSPPFIRNSRTVP
jgi:hypothetical protein